MTWLWMILATAGIVALIVLWALFSNSGPEWWVGRDLYGRKTSNPASRPS